MGLVRSTFFDGDDIAATVLIELDHTLHAALFRTHHHVGQKQRKRFVTDNLACTPDGMAETERFLLAREACRACLGQQAVQQRQLGILVSLTKGMLKLELDVEIVFDDMLAAAGHEHEMLDACLHRLIDDVLDNRLVDDGQHLLRHRLGRWQEPRSQVRRPEILPYAPSYAVPLIPPGNYIALRQSCSGVSSINLLLFCK